MKQYRTCISGAGGSGKSTLVRRIAECTPFIPVGEFSNEILKEHGVRVPSEFPGDPLLDYQRLVNEAKLQAEEEATATGKSWVGDRGTHDLAAYTLFFHSRHPNQEAVSQSVHALMTHSMNTYDVVFLRPWNEEWEVKNNGMRSTQQNYHRAVHILIVGLLMEWGISYVTLPFDLDETVEEFMDFAERVM